MQFFIVLAKGAFLPVPGEYSTKLAPRDYELPTPSSLFVYPVANEEGKKAQARKGEASNQRFTICQPSSNKLSEFYSRPV